MKNIGERVGAILSANDECVKLLGFGVYVGDFKPDVPCLGIPADELPDGFVNPKIELDDGRVVWGCQCWWGDEDKVCGMIDGRRVVVVDTNGNEVGHE